MGDPGDILKMVIEVTVFAVIIYIALRFLRETRGSGVLVLREGEWKVAQYNLTIPIPNPLAGDVVRQIRELEASGEASTP